MARQNKHRDEGVEVAGSFYRIEKHMRGLIEDCERIHIQTQRMRG
jgi:hypothetical protein